MENILGTNLIHTEITETQENVNDEGLENYTKIIDHTDTFSVSLHSMKLKLHRHSVQKIMSLADIYLEENVLFTFYHPDDVDDTPTPGKNDTMENLIDNTNYGSTLISGDDTIRSRKTISKSKHIFIYYRTYIDP